MFSDVAPEKVIYLILSVFFPLRDDWFEFLDLFQIQYEKKVALQDVWGQQ